MGPGRGMGMMGGGGMHPGMMDGSMGGGMGMAGMPPGALGGMGPMGPMMGRGMPGRGAMMEQQAAMLKRRRMLELQERGMGAGPLPPPVAGGGGMRGGGGGGMMSAGMGGAVGPRPPAVAPGGFLKQRQATAQYRNGGVGPPPEPQLLGLINEAVTPQAILHLWGDETRAWAEGHLGQGLLRFAEIVDEICPEDTHEVRTRVPDRLRMRRLCLASSCACLRSFVDVPSCRELCAAWL